MLNPARYIAICVACAATLAGCDDRAPESALYGTWQEPGGEPDEPTYYQFKPDHTFSILGKDGQAVGISGRWYAGGPNIYLRFPAEVIGESRPIIWHIVDISPNEIAIRVWRKGGVIHYRRVNLASPPAS